MSEDWKPIAGYEGLYEVSDAGRVRRIGREGLGRRHKAAGRIMAQNINTAGGRQGARMYVSLYANGKMRKILVHRLVAEAFIPNPDGLTDVCHIDHDPRNNCADNLKWATHRQNIRESVQAGRWARRVSDSRIREIRRRANAGEKQIALAREFGLAYGTINSIVTGRSWRHVT